MLPMQPVILELMSDFRARCCSAHRHGRLYAAVLVDAAAHCDALSKGSLCVSNVTGTLQRGMLRVTWHFAHPVLYKQVTDRHRDMHVLHLQAGRRPPGLVRTDRRRHCGAVKDVSGGITPLPCRLCS